MRKRQRISIDFNVRKPKLQINHSVSRNVNKNKDENYKDIINNPYLAHTLDSASSQDIVVPPPPSSAAPPLPPPPSSAAPPLPPPPPVISDTSSSLNYLLNYEDSSSESEPEDNKSNATEEKEKEKEKEKEIQKVENKNSSDLMNSFENFLSEINELENKNNNISLISKNETEITNNNACPSLSKVTNKILNNEKAYTHLPNSDNNSEYSYHDSSNIIINKLSYLATDKSIIYTTTPTQDFLYHQIEFSTRYNDWSVGALNSDYFINYHNEINNLLLQIEEYFSPPGWKIQWDVNNSLYYYENKKTKLKSWEYPKTIETNPETFIENDEEDDENMDLESDSEIITYKEIKENENIKEKITEKEKPRTKHKKVTTIKDKNMLKLMQKWKKVEDSLNDDDSSDSSEKIEKWVEEQRNKVDSSENPNFEPISGNWREKILKRKTIEKDI